MAQRGKPVMKRLVFLLAVGALAISCASRRHVIVTHPDPGRTVHVHDVPRTLPPPTVVHVHDPSCGHVLETHEPTGYDTTIVVRDAPPQIRPKFHTHGASCGHVYVDGRWLPPGQAKRHVPPGQAKRHVHGEGCGHVWVYGRWLTVSDDAKKKDRRKHR